ncbi:MAG TPA: EF-hand domain-containing protein, partial [Gemmataceae bacterium]
PATGTIDYRWVTIDPKLKEDVWVRGVEVRPGNRSVVHHILMFVLPPGQRRVDDVQEAGYFAAYAPGVNPRWFPEGHGKRIPAGGRIVFQLHYTANGAATTDRSSVGLYLAEGSNLKEVHTLGIANPRLFLPAGKPDVVVTQKHRLTQDVLLTALMPHTHLRGTSFRYDVTYPDGRREALLNVPRYDFNWQTGYELAEPKRLPEGSVILCTATYDNSENNPNNPDPTVDVRWGKQTWDEMMIGYFDYIPLGGKPEPPGGAEGRQRRREALRKFFEGLDKDKNGTISPDEVPALYRRGFERMLQRYDANDDGSLSRDEVPGLEGE